MSKTTSETTITARMRVKMAQLARQLARTQQRLREAKAPTLRDLMRRGGHTPTTLARATGIPIDTIYDFQIARGRKRCPLRTAGPLAEALGVPVPQMVAAWEAERARRTKR